MTEDLLSDSPIDEDTLSESPLSESPMQEDLLTKIRRETYERMHELRGAVDEHDRLTAELSALQEVPERPVARKPPVVRELPVVPEPPVVPGPPVDPGLSAAPEVSERVAEPSVNVVRLPARLRVPRTRMVSPKVARLMRAPRRPALERAGVARVGTWEGSPAGDDPFPGVDPRGNDEVDVEAEHYEHSF
jgi:hypothetical protein